MTKFYDMVITSKYLIKKAQKPCSPLEKAWKILFFFSLRVQHVIKELCPQLGAKQMERLGKRYQKRTFTCHQRLKLSFTTHLFFTVLTLFSNVFKCSCWEDVWRIKLTSIYLPKRRQYAEPAMPK